MKKIILLMITIVSNLYCIAQQQVENAVGTVALPKEVNKISKDEATTFAHKRFKHLPDIGKFDKIYTVGDIMITIREQANIPYEKYIIADQKSETEALFKRTTAIKVHKSEIISVNNKSFFVFESQIDDEVTLSFMCDVRNKNSLFCILQYKSADEDKAQKIFKNIMNDFKYKN